MYILSKADDPIMLDILSLSKTAATKRLQQAVRQSQGSKRACWAASECPTWWTPNVVVELRDGETAQTLPFISKSKGNWELLRMQATLLLYEGAHILQQTNDVDIAIVAEPTVQEQSLSPKLVAIETAKESSEQTILLSIAEVHAKKATPRVTRSKKGAENSTIGAKKAVKSEPAIDDTDEPPSDMENTEQYAAKASQPSPVPTEALAADADSERGSELTPSDEGQDSYEKLAEDKAIFEKELGEWEAEAWEKANDMRRDIESAVFNLKQQYQMFKMSLPKNIREMPLNCYIEKFGGDPRKHMLDQVVHTTLRVIEDPQYLSTPPPQAESSVSPHKRARRQDVVATARKASRAAQARQREAAAQELQQLTTRRRPVRASALRGADRTRAVLQGNSVMRRRRPPPPAFAGKKAVNASAPITMREPTTPPTRGLRGRRGGAGQRKGNELEETARKLSDPLQFVAERRAALQAELAEVEALDAQLRKEREEEQ